MRVGPATPTSAPDDAALRAAAREMEAVLLRQMLRSSGAYGGGEGPGASIREDLFVNALADAVVQSGGLGLAETLTRAMGPAAARSTPAPAPAPVPAPVPAPAPAPGLSTLPTDGRLSSPFGVRTDPFTGAPREHRGVDVGAPEGSAIRATADGVVRAAGTATRWRSITATGSPRSTPTPPSCSSRRARSSAPGRRSGAWGAPGDRRGRTSTSRCAWVGGPSIPPASLRFTRRVSKRIPGADPDQGGSHEGQGRQ